MQAVILGAGEGTRIRPLSASVSQPMVPGADRPLVAHTAAAAGATGLVFVGHHADAIHESFGSEHAGVTVEYAVRRRRAGTSDASVNHRWHVGEGVPGSDVDVGVGTAGATPRHDDRPVDLTVEGERVSTGRRTFGVVPGEGTQTGIDTSHDQGIRLSAGATGPPGKRVVRDR